MPGLNALPRSPCVIMQHDAASEYLAVAYPTLRRHEASANIVLAHALKRVSADAALSGLQFTSDADVEAWLSSADASSFAPHPNPDAFWLTMWSQSPNTGAPVLDMVLACVDWTLGNYPIFLWTPKAQTTLSPSWLEPRMRQLTEHLQRCVPRERVFSVFGKTPLVNTFALYWSKLTGFATEPEPFYAASFSYCNIQTFKDSSARLPEGDRLRRAAMGDLESVAQLCKEFADDSVFFPLSLDRARVEARELIKNGQIWVYTVDGEVTTICAVTRNTHRVSAITKVYTTPKWRRRGCAEFLVRYVTGRLLSDVGVDRVVLYVGYENNAQKVYHRVGFAGLCGTEKVEAVEDSLELGFVGTQRGHW